MGWWWIIGFIFLAAIIWVIFRSSVQNNSMNNSASQKSALDILNEIYAQGEIDKEEYETKKRDLGL